MLVKFLSLNIACRSRRNNVTAFIYATADVADARNQKLKNKKD
jgi:hypothetical protein